MERSGSADRAKWEGEDLLQTEELFRLLVEQVKDYSILALDPAGRIVSWNTGATRIKGYEEREVIGQHIALFYPAEAVARGEPELALAVAAAEGRFEGEGWRVRKDGTRFWAHVVITALREEGEQLVGFAKVVRDLTEQRRSEAATRVLHREQAARVEAEAGRERIAAILESISDGFIALDREWRFTYINRPAQELLGTAGRELVGRELFEALPDFSALEIAPRLEEALAGQGPVQFRAWFPSIQLWLALNVNPSRDGLSISLRDVTERYRAQRAEWLLAEAGRILAESLDYETTLPRVARLLVTDLADICSIDLVENGRVRPLAVAARDLAAEEAIRRVRRPRRQSTPPHEPLSELRIGRSIYAPQLTESLLGALLPDPEDRQVIKGLMLDSVMLVPVVARGHFLGVITVGVARGGRRLDGADLALVEELARRAAYAVDNARLFESALAANRAKSDFLAVVSHELRTPLNAIAACADLLEAEVVGPLNERQREQLERIEGNADRLAHLISEILTFSRTESEMERVRLESVDLVSLFNEVVAVLMPQAIAKGLRIHTELPEHAPPIRTDPSVVQRILANLLGNAVHFTHEGEVLLGGRIEGDTLLIEVRDTGIGIPADSLGLIFEPFWQREGGLTRRSGGTGLGLPIARRLSRLLGGDIVARSEVGKGSTFTVRLPKAIAVRKGETVAA